jgi:hypothetical protein
MATRKIRKATPDNFVSSTEETDEVFDAITGTPKGEVFKEEPLALHTLTMSSLTQPRVQLRQDVIDDYAGKMHKERGRTGWVINPMTKKRWEPIVVFTDGDSFWLADGYHRVKAAQKRGLQLFQAKFRKGTKFDAFKFSLSVNENHGLKRSKGDQAHIARKALLDPHLRRLSSRELGDLTLMSHTYILKIKKQMIADGLIPDDETVKGGDGKIYPATVPQEPTQPMVRKAGSKELPGATEEPRVQKIDSSGGDEGIVEVNVEEQEIESTRTWREELETVADNIISFDEADDTHWAVECAIVVPKEDKQWSWAIEHGTKLEGADAILLIPMPPSHLLLDFMLRVDREQRMNNAYSHVHYCIVGRESWLVLSKTDIDGAKFYADFDDLLAAVGIAAYRTVEIRTK